MRFRDWLSWAYVFRLNPFGMPALAESEDTFPKADLSNFSRWYRHMSQAYPRENAKLIESLRETLDGFDQMGSSEFGEGARQLFAEFVTPVKKPAKLYFDRLSEGQRCLIYLYSILHFVLSTGSTVVIDEPDNFVSLREIQPWLMAASEAVEDGGGQLLLISHHPELINQWAPDCGVQLVRDTNGPARVEDFRGHPDSALSPAELVARGWDGE